jgi:hypothetical protein
MFVLSRKVRRLLLAMLKRVSIRFYIILKIPSSLENIFLPGAFVLGEGGFAPCGKSIPMELPYGA